MSKGKIMLIDIEQEIRDTRRHLKDLREMRRLYRQDPKKFYLRHGTSKGFVRSHALKRLLRNIKAFDHKDVVWIAES